MKIHQKCLIFLKEKFHFLAFIVTYESKLSKINIGNLNYESRILEKWALCLILQSIYSQGIEPNGSSIF